MSHSWCDIVLKANLASYSGFSDCDCFQDHQARKSNSDKRLLHDLTLRLLRPVMLRILPCLPPPILWILMWQILETVFTKSTLRVA